MYIFVPLNIVFIPSKLASYIRSSRFVNLIVSLIEKEIFYFRRIANMQVPLHYDA